jgi:uncharacterized membrane protein YhaH (DUF805 family)
MKGNVIGFDPDTNTGAISGHDGNRYDFATIEWRGQTRPRHGDLVDFQPAGQRATQIYLVEAQYVAPPLGPFLFSPHGRISRSQYWLKFWLPVVAIIILLVIMIGLTRDTGAVVIFSMLYFIFALVLIWPQIAISIKRAHDRDWPWPFILLLFVPFVQFWPLVELGFLRGTIGGNRFGPDPVPRQ